MEALCNENYRLRAEFDALMSEQERVRQRLTEIIFQNQTEQDFLAERIRAVKAQYESFEKEIKSLRKRADSTSGKPDHSDESFQLDSNGEIKAATKAKLIENLCFVEHKQTGTEAIPQGIQHLTSHFLLTYRYFATTMEVISDIHEGYKRASVDFSDNSIVHIKTVSFLKKWINEFADDFIGDPESMEKCVELIHSFINTDSKLEGTWNMGTRLRDLLDSKMKGQGLDRSNQKLIFSTPPPTVINPKPSPGGLLVLDLSPLELARQLTLVDYNLCKSIRPKECLGLAWTKKDKVKRSPNLLQMIDRFNHVSRWVTYTMVSEQNLKKRTKILSFFVQLIQHLYELNNFNSIFAIVGGFGNSAVHRLAKTFAGLKPDRRKFLEEMRFLTDPIKSWGNYRKKITEVDPPCVPFIGVYQTDLTFIEEGNPDKFAGTELINFKKCRMIADVIVLIQQYQQKPYNLEASPDIQKFMTEESKKASEAEEKTLYELSLKAEPRQQS